MDNENKEHHQQQQQLDDVGGTSHKEEKHFDADDYDEEVVVEEEADVMDVHDDGYHHNSMMFSSNNHFQQQQQLQQLQQQHGEDRCKLFVGQIPKSWDSKAVFELFKEFGVQECSIITDRITGRHCSCAFIRVSSESDGQRAIEHFHNKVTIPPMKNPLQVRVASHSASSRIRSNSNTNSSQGRNSDLTSSTTASGGQGLHGFGSFSSMSTNPLENRGGRTFNPEIHEQCKIFVVNSSPLSEDDLTQLFSQFGKIVSVLCLSKRFFPNSPQQGNTKFCSIITFETHAEAVKAVNSSVICPKSNIPMVVKWSKRQIPRNNHQYYQSYQDYSAFGDPYAAIHYPNIYPPSSMPYLPMGQNTLAQMQAMYFLPVDPNAMNYQTGSPMVMMPTQQQQQQLSSLQSNQQQASSQTSQQQQNPYMQGYHQNQMYMQGGYSANNIPYMQMTQHHQQTQMQLPQKDANLKIEQQ